MARLRSSWLACLLAMGVVAASCTGGGPRPAPPPATDQSPGGTVAPKLQISVAPFQLTAPVERAVAVTWHGKLYVAGGLDSHGVSTDGVLSVDPSTGRVKQVGRLPQPFHDAAAAVLGDRLLVFGGGSVQGTDIVQAFDLLTGKGSVVGHLPVALSDLSAAVVGTTAYLVGGFDGSIPRREIYSTSDGVSFSLAGTLPAGLRYAAVAPSGSGVVIAGGVSKDGPVSTVSEFDPAAGAISTIGHLPSRVGHAAALALGSFVYILGGRDAGGRAEGNVWRVDPGARKVRAQPSLTAPVSDPASVSDGASGWLLGGWRAAPVADVLHATIDQPVIPAGDAGTAPFAGLLLIADRGNDRLLVVDANKKIVWQYPAPSLPPPPFRFYFPDDAFWVHGGQAILVNEEENQVIAEIAYPSGETLWTYGHAGTAGSGPGFLHQPDDAYPYPGGGLVVSDAENCRILFFGPDGRVSRQIGTTSNCVRDLPKSVGYPNGDTPLPNGHLLISELNGGFIDEVTGSGGVVWSVRVPGVPVPSDPQRLADGSYLTVDYQTPGRVVRFDSTGNVLWSFGPLTGPGELHNPSLGAPLPNGLVAVNDDFGNRVVIIDPATDRIVWQYGVDGVAGAGPDLLRIPDGLDLLLPGGAIPLHVDFASGPSTLGAP
jgi:hypothetical protein